MMGRAELAHYERKLHGEGKHDGYRHGACPACIPSAASVFDRGERVEVFYNAGWRAGTVVAVPGVGTRRVRVKLLTPIPTGPRQAICAVEVDDSPHLVRFHVGR